MKGRERVGWAKTSLERQRWKEEGSEQRRKIARNRAKDREMEAGREGVVAPILGLMAPGELRLSGSQRAEDCEGCERRGGIRGQGGESLRGERRPPFTSVDSSREGAS